MEIRTFGFREEDEYIALIKIGCLGGFLVNNFVRIEFYRLRTAERLDADSC